MTASSGLPGLPQGPLLVPSATLLESTAAGRVVICGSHGGHYPAELARRSGVRAVLFSDAGIGREAAGIAGLELLDRAHIAGAALDCNSARIGDAQDMRASGRVSCVNGPAAECGVQPGMSCERAAERLSRAPVPAAAVREAPVLRGESRMILAPGAAPSVHAIVLVDSAALVDPVADRGAIVVTGSHGGLVGGEPSRALAAPAFAAVFNDAGIGKDQAGIGRLVVLQARGIRALTVSSASARIGEARSTFDDGIISAANELALAAGALVGQPVRELLQRWSRERA